ncbi:hypothetical protein KEM60_00262 [Austwickia sp. TVS 96-490-7B]|nr:hypothetical protein [Austwickia sp. TVS 96-490-7B]
MPHFAATKESSGSRRNETAPQENTLRGITKHTPYGVAWRAFRHWSVKRALVRSDGLPCTQYLGSLHAGFTLSAWLGHQLKDLALLFNISIIFAEPRTPHIFLITHSLNSARVLILTPPNSQC